MIELNHIFYGYEPRQIVLNDVSLTIKTGDWLTVLGANASGKTTLAMMLNGLLLPKRGHVIVDSYDTANTKTLNEVRKMVAFVFQNPDNQIVGATVEEDIAFGPCNLGLPREDTRKRVEEALSVLGLESYRDHAPHMLSGGQKQKVALAGALAMHPNYLVLDEACSMLDPKSRGDFWQSVKMLQHELNIAVINISHFTDEILLGNRIMLLSKGRLEAEI